MPTYFRAIDSKIGNIFPSILKRLQRSSLTAAITAADAANSAPLPPPVAKPKGTPPALPLVLPDGTVQIGLGPGGALSKKQIAQAKNPPAQQPPPQQQQQQQQQRPNPASQPNPKTTTGAGTGKALTFNQIRRSNDAGPDPQPLDHFDQ